MKILVLLLLAAGCSLAADMQIVSDFQEENVRRINRDKQGRTRLSRTSENNRAF